MSKYVSRKTSNASSTLESTIPSSKSCTHPVHFKLQTTKLTKDWSDEYERLLLGRICHPQKELEKIDPKRTIWKSEKFENIYGYKRPLDKSPEAYKVSFFTFNILVNFE